MAKFTKELRQEIVREFAIRHNGQFNPALFVEEVKATGSEHPAYAWFEWNTQKAATEYLIWQAREFTHGLVVTFKIETVGRRKSIKVREVAMPAVISSVASRGKGGGYTLVDPADPDHMVEYCHQAATALTSWLVRYASAVEHVGASVPIFRKLAAQLEAVRSKKKVAA